MTARLLIADYPLIRLGVRLALSGEDVAVCAEAGDAQEAILAAEREQPDVCIIGFDLPEGGLVAVKGVRRAAPNAAVVVLAQNANARDLLLAIRAGAVGYAPVDGDEERLRRCLRAVLAHEAAVPRALVRELVQELQTEVGHGAGDLTVRESQVLTRLRHGETTTAIARELAISPVTVRRHISELMNKFGVTSRDGLLHVNQ